MGGLFIKRIVNRMKLSVAQLNRINPNILIFIFYGLLYDASYNSYRPFSVKFLERLGGTSFHISMLDAFSGLVGALVLLPGSFFVAKHANKKSITVICFLLSRLFLLLIAFVPFFEPGIQATLFLVLLSIMNFPEAIAQTSLQGLLGELFNGKVRATAISLRNKFGYGVIILVTLLTGLIISVFPRNHEERIIYYQFFFVASFLFGLYEVYMFAKFKKTEPTETGNNKITKHAVKEILKNKPFRDYLFTSIIFQYAWRVGWPLTVFYQIKNLQADEIRLAIFSISAGLASFLSAGFWNRLIQKKGNNHAFSVAALIMSFVILFMVLTPNVYVMTFTSAFNGFAIIGANVTLLNGLLRVTPEENRLICLGTYNTFVNIAILLSCITAFLLINNFNVEIGLYVVFGMRLLSFGFVLFRNLRKA